MDARQLIHDLRNLGVSESDTIIVHSSYKALKGNENIIGGPQAIIEALKETVCNGTLMLPTLSYKDVSLEHRIFDVKRTPSCVGILPATMLLQPDVYRSIHPTHSIGVWGKDAYQIAQSHQNDFSPVGPFSPLSEVRRRHGKIVMLGCGLRCNTSMHGVEEMIVPDYLYRGNFDYQIILDNDDEMIMDVLRHDFKGYEQRYDRILDVLDEDDYQVGYVLKAQCYVMKADVLWHKALLKMKEDPHYFVEYKGEEQ